LNKLSQFIFTACSRFKFV